MISENGWSSLKPLRSLQQWGGGEGVEHLVPGLKYWCYASVY